MKVLRHLARADRTNVRETAGVTGLTLREVGAAFSGLERRGWAFQRTGRQGFDREVEVPPGVYIVTPEGRRWAQYFEEWGYFRELDESA
jgi:hypothetical protein